MHNNVDNSVNRQQLPVGNDTAESGETATASAAGPAAATADNLYPSHPSTPESGLPRQHIPSAGAILTSVTKVDVGVQTDADPMTQELLESRRRKRQQFGHVLKKYELIGDTPTLFHAVDDWVLEISKKRYKSLKHIVRLLADRIVASGFDKRTEDLLKVRAFFRWCTYNIRYYL